MPKNAGKRILAAMVLMVALIACDLHLPQNVPAEDVDVTSVTAAAATPAVTLENAKRTALQAAGVDSALVAFTKAAKTYERGHYEYQIHFTADGWLYKYAIHAASGKILYESREQITLP
ncbi:MAG: PepSY domain-containing protein [Oscillospiraceae bacterium]|nr:PepSY domain-containing protein [Oscillospiraceae bacterium]